MSGEGTYVCTLSPELQEIARKELNEDPNRRAQDIEDIRVWMKKQPHINGRTDDKFILMFLRNCKFSLERTKEKIDRFYTIKTALPDWFSDQDPAKPYAQAYIDNGFYLPLKGYDKDGRRVAIMKLAGWDPDKLPVDAIIKGNMNYFHVLMEDEQTQICGMVGINDLAGSTLSQMAHWTPPMMKKLMHCWQDCMPVRMKGFHYVHIPGFFETIFNVFKSFMKEKLKRRIHVHGDKMEVLYDYVPKSILPTEYGGEAGTCKELAAHWKQEIMKERQYFIDEDKYTIDESKRPGKPKTMEDIFGLDGSFRKLNVD